VSSPQHSLDFAFVDTTVPACVENAIHALALDETRTPFSPTMWEKPSESQTLTQVWFAGSHADVGGGYDETAPADITLTWMVGQLSKFMDFDSDLLDFQLYPEVGEKRPWSCGALCCSKF
jgi:hypothetical protein